MVKTVTIQIGNSDDKLQQKQWSDFVYETKFAVECFCEKIHFTGGAESWAPWQNFAVICVVEDDSITLLQRRLAQIRAEYKQDSLAFTVGETVMV
jgi:hypothetical protein